MEETRNSHRSLICFAIVKKACSTLVAFFADVSRKGIASWSENSWTETVKKPIRVSEDMSNLRNTVFHNFLAGQIRLVANEELVNTLRCISVNLLQPLLYIRECVCMYEILARNIFRGGSNRPLSVTS